MSQAIFLTQSSSLAYRPIAVTTELSKRFSVAPGFRGTIKESRSLTGASRSSRIGWPLVASHPNHPRPQSVGLLGRTGESLPREQFSCTQCPRGMTPFKDCCLYKPQIVLSQYRALQQDPLFRATSAHCMVLELFLRRSSDLLATSDDKALVTISCEESNPLQ